MIEHLHDALVSYFDAAAAKDIEVTGPHTLTIECEGPTFYEVHIQEITETGANLDRIQPQALARTTALTSLELLSNYIKPEYLRSIQQYIDILEGNLPRNVVMQEGELIGLAETANLLGVSKQTVNNWTHRYPRFPKPLAILQCGPIYAKSAILQYKLASEKAKDKPDA